ncbi:MAG: hypothetical protein GC152_12325 [Alphaproteobacteria bacterium]|nr:hypothetical protein [Alphaproteobacteria bacterium]
MAITAPDLIGLLGAALIVVAYAASQADRLDTRGVAYSAMNLAGAAAILVSLAFAFNLASFAIELVWLVVSVYGLFRAVRRRDGGD